VPFSFATKDGERTVTGYYRAPEEALESPPLMLPWARLAFEAALRAANAKAKKPGAGRKSAAKQPAAKKPAAVAKRAARSTAKKPAAKKTAARG
jgi:DNA transformation protein